MNAFEEAFEELLATAAEVNGGRNEQLKIGDVQYDAIIAILTTDETVIAGGIAESGGFKAMVRTSVPIPVRYVTVSYYDAQNQLVDLQVLSTNENDGYTEIVGGDPSAL